jgi:hypothetical protein
MDLRMRSVRARWALAALLGCVALLILAPTVLAAGGTGRISGTVEAGGKRVENVNVLVISAGREFAGFATTNANGEYEVTGLAAASYRVKFEPGRGSIYAPQFYSGKSSFSEATPVPVEEAKTTTGIDAELHEGGTISGTVTGAGAGGLEHVGVFVFTAGEGPEFFGSSTVTGAGGEYKVTGLATGSYTVEFYPENGFGLNFVPQYYEGAALLSGAKQVSVTEGKTKSGINATLQEGGKISGTVTDAVTHKPLAKVSVSAYGIVGGEEGFGGFTETNANGEYTILGLGNGTYKVEFEGPGGPADEYITQYYNNEPTFASANLVTANQGSTTPVINAALVRKAPVNAAGPVVSGTPAVGQTLSCANGSWTGEPTPTFTHTWLRNGAVIAGATGRTYVVQTADEGTGLACKVTATNKHGSASAVSNTLTVPTPPPPPPSPIVELPSTKLIVSGGSARVPLICAGSTCAGTIELTEQIVVKHRHHGRTRSRRETIVLARGSYALAAGQTATIFVRLTHAGKNALARARRHQLSATARVSVIGGATQYASVVLSERARKHGHHGHR